MFFKIAINVKGYIILLTYSKATTYLVNFNYCQIKVFTFAMNDLFNIYLSIIYVLQIKSTKH